MTVPASTSPRKPLQHSPRSLSPGNCLAPSGGFHSTLGRVGSQQQHLEVGSTFTCFMACLRSHRAACSPLSSQVCRQQSPCPHSTGNYQTHFTTLNPKAVARTGKEPQGRAATGTSVRTWDTTRFQRSSPLSQPRSHHPEAKKELTLHLPWPLRNGLSLGEVTLPLPTPSKTCSALQVTT